MNKTLALIVLVAMTALTACATVLGGAREAWGAGKFMARQFSD
ncbi:MAG: hypothetical protein ACSHWY_00930 [Octadecabacter sp.]